MRGSEKRKKKKGGQKQKSGPIPNDKKLPNSIIYKKKKRGGVTHAKFEMYSALFMLWGGWGVFLVGLVLSPFPFLHGLTFLLLHTCRGASLVEEF